MYCCFCMCMRVFTSMYVYVNSTYVYLCVCIHVSMYICVHCFFPYAMRFDHVWLFDELSKYSFYLMDFHKCVGDIEGRQNLGEAPLGLVRRAFVSSPNGRQVVVVVVAHGGMMTSLPTTILESPYLPSILNVIQVGHRIFRRKRKVVNNKFLRLPTDRDFVYVPTPTADDVMGWKIKSMGNSHFTSRKTGRQMQSDEHRQTHRTTEPVLERGLPWTGRRRKLY